MSGLVSMDVCVFDIRCGHRNAIHLIESGPFLENSWTERNFHVGGKKSSLCRSGGEKNRHDVRKTAVGLSDM